MPDPHLPPAHKGGARRAAVETMSLSVPGDASGEIRFTVLRPAAATGPVPVVLYLPGTPWPTAARRPPGRLVELAARARAAVVVAALDSGCGMHRTAAAPTAERFYAAASGLAAHGSDYGLDTGRLALAGEWAGAPAAAQAAMTAGSWGSPELRALLLLSPLLPFDGEAYGEGAYGHTPTAAEGIRLRHVNRRPRYCDLPPSFLAVTQADGPAAAARALGDRLRAAGVPLTGLHYAGSARDFLGEPALCPGGARDLAMGRLAAFLRRSLRVATDRVESCR